MKKILIFVIYDGVLNPVFSGQVIQPILSKIMNDPDLHVYLVSFEKENLPKHIIDQYVPVHPNLSFIKFKRYPVLSKISLLHSVYLLRRFLKNISSYNIKARGPFAGWVSMYSARKQNCESFAVQARALNAVEYDMLFKIENNFQKIFHNYRKKLFAKIEKEVYNPKKKLNNFCIESITPALSDYLISHYCANNEFIKMASEDIPKQIAEEQKIKWRNEIRSFLKLSPTTHIYCYNGSAKPWQSLDLTIDFFKKKLQKNDDVFLLILTQDIYAFENIMSLKKIEPTYYKILNVKHKEIYKYLSACDTGLIFRKEHLANWVSRPIKALEYEAAGLNIVHNDTVKWLIDKSN